MSNEGMTAADVGAVIGSRDGGWMGSEWIFGLIVLAAMMNGGFGGWGFGGNRGGGDCLTTAESCNMNSFNEMKSQIGRMNDMMFTNARQNDNAICTLGYQAAEHANATQRLIDGCCCDIKTAIHAEGEATRNMLQQNRYDDVLRENQDLKLQSMFCGVPRIPTSFTYAVNPGALFNSGCYNDKNCGNPIFQEATMSCKAKIARAVFDSPTVQAVDAGGVINLPEVTKNTRCVNVTGGAMAVRNGGTYNVHANITAVATAAGVLEFQLYRNGTPVPGAHALVTAAAVGDNVSVAFFTPLTVECCGSTTIDLRSATATTIRVANITLEQV